MAYCNCDYTPPEFLPCMNCRRQSAEDARARDERERARATEYKQNQDGVLVVLGHHAVDPSGHLVRLKPNARLPSADWRWATQDDMREKVALERQRELRPAELAPGEDLEPTLWHQPPFEGGATPVTPIGEMATTSSIVGTAATGPLAEHREWSDPEPPKLPDPPNVPDGKTE